MTARTSTTSFTTRSGFTPFRDLDLNTPPSHLALNTVPPYRPTPPTPHPPHTHRFVTPVPHHPTAPPPHLTTPPVGQARRVGFHREPSCGGQRRVRRRQDVRLDNNDPIPVPAFSGDRAGRSRPCAENCTFDSRTRRSARMQNQQPTTGPPMPTHANHAHSRPRPPPQRLAMRARP